MDSSTRKRRRFPERLLFVLVAFPLLATWALIIAFTYIERQIVLDTARTQLTNTVATLADYSALADASAVSGKTAGSTDRSAALWRVLLQYPTANLWLERNGVLFAGQAPTETGQKLVIASAASGDVTAHAAIAEPDLLSGWRRSIWERGLWLAVATAGFLGLAGFLFRAWRQRAVAERNAAVSEERVVQLAQYRSQLEQTVEQRTEQLKSANVSLERELAERKAAEAALRQHDALLAVVTRSASELLNAQSLDNAIADVFELIGQTISVGRVHLSTLRTDNAGHLHSTPQNEWCAPGLVPMIDNAALRDLDLTVQFPTVVGPLLLGQLASTSADELAQPYRDFFEKAVMRSFLHIPVLIEGKPWGLLSFLDAADAQRRWSWAETDTLKALADLIAGAVVRSRYIKALADANMIVQNSPTLLFRLKGEPALPLSYISPNIAKFGHDPAQLMASPSWFNTLIAPEDRAKVGAALTGVLDKKASAGSIEFRLIRGDGAMRWVEARYSPVRDSDGRLVEIEGIMIDVTERRAAEDKIAQLARTDGLTGLANRTTFVERLRQAFVATKRGEPAFAVLYLDLDRFKDINDTLGHPIGDLLLQAAAGRLLDAVRETDLVARLGGDEFAILQTDIAEPSAAGALALKICQTLAKTFRINGNDLHVTASVGVAPMTKETVTPDQLLTQADLALYRAKDEGRDQYRFHTADLDTEVRERVALADDLRKAIENGELELYYQPQVDLASGHVVGMEALTRWNHPQRGIIMPGIFIPMAEKTGAIIALGRWVLDHACGQMKAWKDSGIAPPVIAVNISLAQIKTAREFISDVVETVKKWGLEPSDLELDVTEMMLAQLGWTQNDVLAQLRQLGVKIALDDFGTDYSSFDYVRTYSVNHLKIARQFIELATRDPKFASTIRAIIGLAHEMGVEVIAEGVETAEQRTLLLAMSPDAQAQGFLFSEPESHQRASDFLRAHRLPPTPAKMPLRARPKPRKKAAFGAAPGRQEEVA